MVLILNFINHLFLVSLYLLPGKAMPVAYTAILPAHREINGATEEPGTGRGHRALLHACGRKRSLRKASSASRTTLAAYGPGPIKRLRNWDLGQSLSTNVHKMLKIYWHFT